MNWLTKELTLNLLAITIEGLVKIHDAIDDATQEEQPDTPQEKPDAPAVEAPPAKEGEMAETPPSEPEAEPEPTPPANTPTMPEIQNALRTIAQAEGNEWILNELFKGFGITNITHLPGDKLPLAWELINDHLDEVKESA